MTALIDPNPISIPLFVLAAAALVWAVRALLGGVLPDVAGDKRRLGADPALAKTRRGRAVLTAVKAAVMTVAVTLAVGAGVLGHLVAGPVAWLLAVPVALLVLADLGAWLGLWVWVEDEDHVCGRDCRDDEDELFVQDKEAPDA